MISPSIVNTKYGDRPLIQAPPISFDINTYPSKRSNIADPNYSFGNPTTITPAQQGGVQHMPQYRPNAHQHHHASQRQPRRHGNVVPYPIQTAPTVSTNAHQASQYYSQTPPIQRQQLPPVYNQPQWNPPSQQQTNSGGTNEIHHYYGPNGEELTGAPQNNFGSHNGPHQLMFGPQSSHFHANFGRLPANFVLEGYLEYGHLSTIEVKQSNISYRDLPEFVVRDLKRMYGNVKKTHVKIIGENGEFNIYGTPLTNPSEEKYQGYIYDKPHTSYSRYGRRNQYVDDQFTKKYDDLGRAYLAAEQAPGRAYAYSEHPRAVTTIADDERRLPAPRPIRHF